MRSLGSVLGWAFLLLALGPAFVFNVAGVLLLVWLVVSAPWFWAAAGIYAALCFARWVVTAP